MPAKLARLSRSDAGPWRHAPWVTLGLLVALGVALLAERPNRPVADQLRLVSSYETLQRAPLFTDGATSKTIAAALGAVGDPSPAELNFRVRAFALAAYLGAGLLLARAVLPGPGWVVGFLVLLFASRMPMIWISTELFAGVAVCLAALGIVRGGPGWAVGAALAAGAHTKLDTPLMMLALLGLYGVRSWLAGEPRRLASAALAFGLGWLALTVPWQLQSDGYYAMTRSLTSFSQHYASLNFDPKLVPRMQFEGGDPRPERHARGEPLAAWAVPHLFARRDFPDATSVADVVRLYPRRYLEFVGDSIVRSAGRIAGFLNLVLLLLVARWGWMARRRRPPDDVDWIFWTSLVALAPMILLAYVHVRYLARWLPLVLLLAVDLHARLARGSAPAWTSHACAGLLSIWLAISAYGFWDEWGELEPQHVFWYPD